MPTSAPPRSARSAHAVQADRIILATLALSALIAVALGLHFGQAMTAIVGAAARWSCTSASSSPWACCWSTRTGGPSSPPPA